jgi:hypothetical protein
LNTYLERIGKYQALSLKDMRIWKDDFIDTVFMPYLVWCFENRKNLDDEFYLYQLEIKTEEDILLAKKLKEENSVIWLKQSTIDGTSVMFGCIVNASMRRAFAVEVINKWLEDKDENQ